MIDYEIHTFGCKVNTYDSGLVDRNLKRALGSEAPIDGMKKSSRYHILNTCAVTKEASNEAVRLARQIKNKNPQAVVVITGCAAQVDTKLFSDLPGIDLVVANSHKGQLPELLKQFESGSLADKVYRSNIFKKEDLEEDGGLEAHHTRSFVKIQDGCNSFCSFCVIPYARGKSRSLSIPVLVEKIQKLTEGGVREVVLTGVHIGDYEDNDTKFGLEALVEEILKHTQMPRLRLTSLEPIEISDRLLELYQDPRLCKHFHMSIQSATSRVLKEMKRKYDRESVVDSLKRIEQKVPGAFVGMDVIAGFPTETQEDFEITYQTLAETPWTRLHVFPYSERPGTKAAELGHQVHMSVRKERAFQLRNLSWNRYQEHLQKQVGLEKQVLILKQSSKGAHGLSRDYWPVSLGSLSEEILNRHKGQEVKVKLSGVHSLSAQRMEAVLSGQVQGQLS